MCLKLKILLSAMMLVSVCAQRQNRSSSTTTNTNIGGDSARYCPSVYDTDVRFGGTHCCNSTFASFSAQYTFSRVKLASLLEKLRAWNCPQFQDECKNRHFVFNEFTDLLYDRFCQADVFGQKCSAILEKIGLIDYRNTGLDGLNISTSDYRDLVLESPCVQVATYRYGSPYLEIADPVSAYCDRVWCGLDLNTSLALGDSPWACLPSRCRGGLIVVMVTCGILAVAVIIANATAIFVIAKSPRFSSSQMIYKLSLGIGDLLVGLIVFPSFVGTLYLTQIAPYRRLMPDTNSRPNFNESYGLNTTYGVNFSDFDPSANTYLRIAAPVGYYPAVGFMIALSLMVSINTLMLASYDRYRAISAPLKHVRHSSPLKARRATIVLWVIAVVVSVLPVFVPGIKPYIPIAGGLLVAVSKLPSLVIHGIAFAVPFIAVWVLTIATLVIIRRNNKTRRDMTNNRQVRNVKRERKTTITLAVMVGVFTLSLLPSIVVIILPEIWPNLHIARIKRLNKPAASSFTTAEMAVTIILMCNSLWNCFIYSVRDKEFRSAAATNYKRLASALGLVRLKNVIEDCCISSTKGGRRRISSVFSNMTLRGKDVSEDATASSSISTRKSSTIFSQSRVDSDM